MHRRYGAAVQTDAAPVPVENEPQAAGAARRQARVLLTGCWLLLVVLYPSTATARTSIRRSLAPAHPAPSLRSVAPFTHITIDQGLSDGRVQAIVQDHAGFLWFGTNNGLDRYDGYDIVSYRNDPANPHSLGGNFIGVLHEDRSGTIWIGTRSGLDAFDRRTEQFTHYQHDPANPRSLSDNSVTEIFEGPSGDMWIGTQSGLNRFDRKSGAFTVYRRDPHNPRSLSNNVIRAIAGDRSGALWIGTLDGLNRFDRKSGAFTVYRHDPRNPASLSCNVVWEIYQDRAGTLWVGTDGGGVDTVDPSTAAQAWRTAGPFKHYRHDPHNPHSLGDDRIACFLEDASGALWIGTFGGGVSVLDRARRHFTNYRHDSNSLASLSNNYIGALAADRSGLIWVGTHGTGVDLFHRQRQAFALYRHDPNAAASLASDSVSAVCEGRDGTLWVGTQDRGLDRFDRRSGRIIHYPPNPRNPRRLGHPWVSALEQDRKGALWIGTYGGGLYHLDPTSGRFTGYRNLPANPHSLTHDTIPALHVDRSGTLWIATRGGGLNRFHPASGTFAAYRYDPANPRTLSSDWVWAIAEDRRGNLWIGTIGGGLNRLEPASGRITRYQHDPRNPQSLSDNNIWALHIDRSGVLWVGTVGGGLDRLDPSTTDGAPPPSGRFTHYREQDGLSSDRINAILEDGADRDPAAGNLWIATGRGLSKLDRDRKRFHTYGTSDGLPLTELNRGGCKIRTGELMMSSMSGLIAFDPAAVQDDADRPPLVFTNLLLNNRPVPIDRSSPLHQEIDQTHSLTLPYSDREITFEFAALDFHKPRQIRYRYRLEGFDDRWTEVSSTQRMVTYTNLAPRRYVFRVAAANAMGVWNPAGRSIVLIIMSPWWATWWFRGLALALIVGGACGVYTWRVNSLRRQQHALEAEIVDRKRIEEALRASHRQIRKLAGRLITAQEDERTRIAGELHDDINQQLAAHAITLSGLVRRLPLRNTKLRNELVALQQQIIALCDEVRHLSHELHPGVLRHLGLAAALRGHCAEFGRQHKLDVTFRAGDLLDRLPEDVALCLYRVAQEALHNIAAHAGARRVEVAFARDAAGLEMTIRDDGRGFDLAQAQQRGGLGLISLDERVRLVQGTVEIASWLGQGTELLVHVPLEAPSLPQEPAGEASRSRGEDSGSATKRTGDLAA